MLSFCEQDSQWLLWHTIGTLHGSSRRLPHSCEFNFPREKNSLRSASQLIMLFSLNNHSKFQIMDMLGPNLWDVQDSLEQKKYTVHLFTLSACSPYYLLKV